MDGSQEQLTSTGEIVRGATLTEQVYSELRRRLLVGELEPGLKITARSVGRSMGVSLTPARDAIARLVREGAIEKSETHMYSVPLLDRDRYSEISAVRMLLEPAAAERATAAISDEQIAALAALNERMREKLAEEAYVEALTIDADFHFAIYDAAGAADFRRIIDGLWLLVGPTRTRLPLEYRSRLNGYAIHLKILDALRARDPAAVREAVHTDLSSGAEAVLSVLE